MEKLEEVLKSQLELVDETFESCEILFYGSCESNISSKGRTLLPKKYSNVSEISKFWGVEFDKELYFFPQGKVLTELIPHLFQVSKDEKSRILLPTSDFNKYKKVNSELNGNYFGCGSYFKFSNK